MVKVKNIIFWAEMLIAFAILIVIFFSFLYYSIPFVEERISLITKIGKIWVFIILATCLILPFTEFGTITFLSTFLTNLGWLVVFSRGFPFIDFLAPDLILSIIGSFISHFVFMWKFVNVNANGYKAVCYYLFLIWGVTILSLISFGAVEGSQPKSFWKDFLNDKINKIKSILPKTASKND